MRAEGQSAGEEVRIDVPAPVPPFSDPRRSAPDTSALCSSVIDLRLGFALGDCASFVDTDLRCPSLWKADTVSPGLLTQVQVLVGPLQE